MATSTLTPKELEAYRHRRLARAKRPGSKWIFFRDGDDTLVDPWSGLTIEIVKADDDGYHARCTQPELIDWRKVLAHPDFIDIEPDTVRVVQYSELW